MAQTPFEWVPGQGPDANALERMEWRFPRPIRTMGEAWFMEEVREMYPSLLELDVSEHSTKDLQNYLKQIASGLLSFGHSDSWSDWYGYLLPRCLPRAFERDNQYVGGYLLEYLITGFMSVSPNSSDMWGYSSFRDDALATLGRAIMAPELWPNGPRASIGCLHPTKTSHVRYPVWASGSGDFAASMFFCLKYLKASEVSHWVESVFAIECAHWRAQVLVWLCGAKNFFDGTNTQPTDLNSSFGPGYYVRHIDWELSEIIDGVNTAYNEREEPVEFLPAANLICCHETIIAILDQNLLTEWLESLMDFEYLFDHLTDCEIPELLQKSYQF